MQYYDIYQHFRVPAPRFRDARIKFSRAIEDRDEYQYYIDTSYSFPTDEKPKGLFARFVMHIPWFLEGALQQIFGYPKYHQ